MKIKLIKLPEELEIHVADKKMPWKEAMDYAESIGMRLPTLPELQMIAASTGKFNDLEWCWSASTVSDDPTDAWNVGLGNRGTDTNFKTFSLSVLCVSIVERE